VNIEDLTDLIIDKLLDFKFFENEWYNLEDNVQESVYQKLTDALAEWRDQECFNDDDSM
jgi:hypothetical protein